MQLVVETCSSWYLTCSVFCQIGVIALLLVNCVGYGTECNNVHCVGYGTECNSVHRNMADTCLFESRQERGIIHGRFQWFSPGAPPQHPNTTDAKQTSQQSQHNLLTSAPPPLLT
jgi:hypothetical protein